MSTLRRMELRVFIRLQRKWIGNRYIGSGRTLRVQVQKTVVRVRDQRVRFRVGGSGANLL